MKTRLNLEIPGESRKALERLTKASRSPSLTETIKRSLMLYDLVVEHHLEGGQLVFRHPDGSEEVLTFL